MELQYSPKRGFVKVPQQKRRKVVAPLVGGDFISSLFGLPEGPFCHVLAYLPKEGRASFAVAVAGPPSSFRQWTPPVESMALMRAILSGRKSYINEDWRQDWETFDFGNVKKQNYRGGDRSYLLNDDDLFAILVCIDAKNTVQRLHFTGCFGLTGDGLMPICGSTKLTQIDLSLLGERECTRSYWSGSDYWMQGEKYHRAQGPKFHWLQLSMDAVVRTLHSIIDQEGNRLKHLTLPAMWRPHYDSEQLDPLLESFLARYNDIMLNNSIACAGGASCSNRCAAIFEMSQEESTGVGVQALTCYKCVSTLCDASECPSGKKTRFCSRCEKYYCDSCARYPSCKSCGDAYLDWADVHCDSCVVCEPKEYGDSFFCKKCGDFYCGDYCGDDEAAEECLEIYCAMCDYGPICRQCCRKIPSRDHDIFACDTGKVVCSDNCMGEWERKEHTREKEREEFPPLEVLPWQKKITAFVQR